MFFFSLLIISLDFLSFFLNCDSLHARLNNHYEARSNKTKKYKKIKAFRKTV